MGEQFPATSPLLTLRHIVKRFGGVTALNDVSFEVQQGEILGVIGPNGAGKSTLLSLISGAQRPSTGEITFDDQRLDRLPTHTIARLGIGRAHQIPRPLGRMTVQQNVLVPVHSRGNGTKGFAHHADEVLETCGLLVQKNELAGSLTLLNLKRLELARALALQPRLLLLDEVAAGLVAHEIAEITQLISSIQARGVTIVLVEHVQAVVHALARRVIVLDWGRKIAEGTPREIAQNAEVIAVYLGTDQGAPAQSDQETPVPVLDQISTPQQKNAVQQKYPRRPSCVHNRSASIMANYGRCARSILRYEQEKSWPWSVPMVPERPRLPGLSVDCFPSARGKCNSPEKTLQPPAHTNAPGRASLSVMKGDGFLRSRPCERTSNWEQPMPRALRPLLQSD